MEFGEAVKSCFSKYVTWEGRAPRSEYWFFALFVFLVAFVAALCMIVSPKIGVPLYVLVALGTLLPNLSVLVRRLHDTDRSGWWYWIVLVPVIGAILLLVWFCTRGTEGSNRFGDDPLGGM